MDAINLFLTLGGLFLAGLLADQVGRRTRLPRVTLLLACGVIAGNSGLDMLPDAARSWYDFLSVTALTMVAFLLGSSLTIKTMAASGRAIFSVSIAIVITSLGVVTMGLLVIGAPLEIALLLAGIATATDPAATQDVIRQIGARGPFVNTLKGIVAIDDAWGLLAFSLVLAGVGMLSDMGGANGLRRAGWEITGAVGLGIAIGLPASFLTGRLQPGEPLQAEALGIVFLTAGFALWLDVSFLIAAMTAGGLVANLADHHKRAFHEIEHVQWPFMILFFILAGASLDVASLGQLGAMGTAYVVLRILARLIGGWIGAGLGGMPGKERIWIGPALLPQAGVAIGMALVAGQQFPQFASSILTLAVATTVIFEFIGPLCTLLALRRVGADQTAGDR